LRGETLETSVQHHRKGLLGSEKQRVYRQQKKKKKTRLKREVRAPKKKLNGATIF